jgi:tRNA threonylcarbamoyladenosine biosynthesis protein TsaE
MKKLLLSELSGSVGRTEELGADIARLALGNGIMFAALFGELGAGKTALTRGIVSVFASGAFVCSPTYAIVNEYYPVKSIEIPGKFGANTGEMPVFHFDMYRVEDEDSLDSVGFFDYLNRGGFIVTEWSENIVNVLPERYFEVNIDKVSDEERKISVYLVEL